MYFYFPQLVGVVYADPNTYGSACAYVIGLVLRFGGGEPFFNLEPFIAYPGGDFFPFKTFSMLISGITLMVVSYIAKYLFTRGYLRPEHDFLGCNLANGGRSHLNKKRFDMDELKKEREEADDDTESKTEKKEYENDGFEGDMTSTQL